MKKLYKSFIIFLFGFTSVYAQNNVSTYKNPVISGDFPDPTIIRVGEDYYASGTTSDFAPNYPIFHSKDLVNWERIGAVFNDPPEWIKGDCWAPELFYNAGTYYMYYTARRKTDNITCIGVATTKDITKGFTDHGILIEWGNEAIDAYVFKDDDGKLYISWKAYGLDSSRPIELLSSELTSDGLSLKGEPFSMTRQDDGWKEKGDEGQCIVKHGDYYYLFYSVGGCCDNRCDYRVEVARSKNLKEGWKQYEGNPILAGGELWKCSGHGTLVQVPDGRYFYLYHAYQSYDFEYIGRQGLLDELVWDESTGWPYFKNGKTPSLQAATPFAGTIQKRKNVFYDNFQNPDNRKYWIWDMNLPQPVIEKQVGKIKLSTTEPGFCFLGVNPQTGNYLMETKVENGNANFSGLCVYGHRSNFFIWGVENGQIKLYKQEGGARTELFSQKSDEPNVYLRISSINGRSFHFHWSSDQNKWFSYPSDRTNLDGSFLPAWGKGVRCGLFIENTGADSNYGYFSYFSLENKY